jgi:hypothetical protein
VPLLWLQVLLQGLPGGALAWVRRILQADAAQAGLQEDQGGTAVTSKAYRGSSSGGWHKECHVDQRSLP